MKDKKLKKYVISLCQKHAWNIQHTHYELVIEYPDKDKEKNDGLHVLGEMVVDRRYLKGTLRLYPKALRHWNGKDDGSIEEVVSHEIAHLATQHFMDVATATYRDEGEMHDAWESCTELIARLSRKIKTLEEKL